MTDCRPGRGPSPETTSVRNSVSNFPVSRTVRKWTYAISTPQSVARCQGSLSGPGNRGCFEQLSFKLNTHKKNKRYHFIYSFSDDLSLSLSLSHRSKFLTSIISLLTKENLSTFLDLHVHWQHSPLVFVGKRKSLFFFNV